MATRAKTKPTTPPPNREERAAIAFEPLPLFDWTNERWAEAHLPIIRLASAFLAENGRADLRVRIKGALDWGEDVVPDVLDDFNKTKAHLKSLVELLDAASARVFLVLEDLGRHNEDDYTPKGKWRDAS